MVKSPFKRTKEATQVTDTMLLAREQEEVKGLGVNNKTWNAVLALEYLAPILRHLATTCAEQSPVDEGYASNVSIMNQGARTYKKYHFKGFLGNESLV